MTVSSLPPTSDLDHRRQQRQHDDADQPEPARHQRAPPQPLIGAQMLDQRPGRGRDVLVDDQIGRGLAGLRNEQCRDPAQQREGSSPARRSRPGVRRPLAAMPATMVPSRMAMKVAPSTSALPAGNSRRCQMIGQDAVFDRAEQRTDHAEAEQRDIENDQRMGDEADDRETGDRDLDQLQPLRDHRLVDSGRQSGRRAPTERNRAR